MTVAKAKRKAAAKSSPRRANQVLDALEKAHPDARIQLNFENPLQLLVATILAAQCTDERVNEVTPQLFKRYPTARDLAEAKTADVEELVRSTGFFRQKTRSVQACCKALAEEHGGEVPADMEALTRLQGVGRKTASIVLAEAFGQQAIAVDTHVKRVSTRLGLAHASQPDKIEQELCAVIPHERWSRAALLLGTHGRRICTARKPDHERCPVKGLCDFYRTMVKRN
jgi:endonuclease-3